MDPRTRNLFVIALILVIAASGGAALLLSGGPGSAGSIDAPFVDGVVVGVDSEGLDRVRGFNLRVDDGSTVAFTIGTLENGAVFPPGHLVEHQATAQRVRVRYRVEGDTRVAIRLEDAP